MNEDGVGGVAAVVRNHEGDTVGHLRGRYGVRDDGRQVFFAKLVGRGGEFTARVRGRYVRQDDGSTAFSARFHARDGQAIGIIQGKVVDRDDETAGGALLARWAYACDPSISRDGLPPASDAEETDRPSAP